MRILLAALLVLPVSAIAEVVTVDFVRVLNGNTEEAVYFYENNWKKYRIAAVEEGVISSYKLLVKTSESGETDILLVTTYASTDQYESREENFAAIMRDARETGPTLLNDKLPNDFRDVVDGGVYSSD